jgi:outer membrane lipoprotein-sorting protein
VRILRTVSTPRLLAMIAGLVVAVAAGTAIAVAASGSGPVPPAKPLANAVHNALAAPKINGISARISFTNHLIDASNIQGSDPILTGATGRLWLASDHRMRLELQSDNGDAQVVVNNRSFWVYDPSSRTVYEGKIPAGRGKADKSRMAATAKAKLDQMPSLAKIQSELARISKHVNLSGAIPGDVAGHAAYTVRISPKHDGGLLGSGELAWDAVRGVPLRIGVYAQHDSTPVLELKATDISYGAVSPSVFAISPPTGAKVVKVATPTGHGGAAAADRRLGRRLHKRHAEVSGAAAVARQLPFKLLAPTKLVGLPRRSVTMLDWAGSPAALVSYGQNLGGVAVIEQTMSKPASAASQSSGGDRHQGLSLPTVSINGVTGQELDTALGTMVRFTRAGVTYTVVGSVPAAAADAAARAL